jgi:hypothetical protein
MGSTWYILFPVVGYHARDEVGIQIHQMDSSYRRTADKQDSGYLKVFEVGVAWVTMGSGPGHGLGLLLAWASRKWGAG